MMFPIAVLVPLVLGYALTLKWIWDSWFVDGSYYSHGPLLPPLAAFLVWRLRGPLADAARRFDARGWWLLAPGLLLHVCGAALMVDSLSAFSLCLSVPGAVLLTQGGARWRLLAAVMGLVVFAVPMPMFVTGKLVFMLKEVAVDLGLALGNLLGAGAVRTGANISVPGESVVLEVADACGGLRSLVSLLTVGYVIAFFAGPSRGPVPWLVLLLAAPIAVASNVVRIAGMCWMSSQWGVAFGAGTGHDVLNAVVWLAAIALLLALDTWLTRRLSS